MKVPPVYNYASGEYNPLSFKEAMKMTTTYYPDCPSLYQIYYSFRLDTDSRLIFVIYDFIFHLVPAILADGYLTIRREKPRQVKSTSHLQDEIIIAAFVFQITQALLKSTKTREFDILLY